MTRARYRLSWLRRLAPSAQAHLSDERMAALFCRDLRLPAAWAARRHLAQCQNCRTRQEQLEGPRVDRMLQIYRDTLGNAECDSPSRARAEFAQWLDMEVHRATAPRRRAGSSFAGSALLPSLVALPPAFPAGVALSMLLAATLFSLWQQEHRAPGINANTLLVKAETSGTPSPKDPGVVRQTVRIHTPKATIERAVYWDRQGRRRPRRQSLPRSEAQLSAQLDAAGVDWNQPISASAYRAWHDRQLVRADRITYSSPHLLTLTTTVQAGDVAAESLTVRDTDFHPVDRTVDFRDSGTVEIAEVNFEVLPWNAVASDIFAPLPSLPAGIAVAPIHTLPAMHLPTMPGNDELDETELLARLVLSQLHADTDEQIEIHRSPQAVEVDGLVENDERKHELSTRLMTVPRLKVSIQSATGLRDAPPPAGEVTYVESESLPDHPSALELYLKMRGQSVEQSNTLAQQIFMGAMTISQESRAIADLQTHFAHPERMSPVESGTLAELRYSDHERLGAALRQERLLLAVAQGAPPTGAEAAGSNDRTLTEAAEQNLELARELTQTNAAPGQKAEAIFTKMSAAVEDLITAAHRDYENPQLNTALRGMKTEAH